jgi:DNA-binding CsgD family transcriptional regulator
VPTRDYAEQRPGVAGQHKPPGLDGGVNLVPTGENVKKYTDQGHAGDQRIQITKPPTKRGKVMTQLDRFGSDAQHWYCSARNGLDPIRVGIVDECEIFRRGVVACLMEDPHLLVAADLPFGPVSIQLDVAVVSIRAVRDERFGCPVVVVSPSIPLPNGNVITGNPVMAFLPRSSLTPAQLIATVLAVAAGLRVDYASTEGKRDERLDRRRLEVLRLLAAGANTREIGESLRYSDRTIKTVIQDIERELGVKSRAQAVSEAIRRGLI